MVKGNVFEDARFSSTSQRQFNYVKESMKHPAKMPPELVRELILTYSKKGDTILDPMAGIGTTLVEGILLGRNVVGIEYEKKFKEIIDKNVALTIKNNKQGPIQRSLGKATVIKGDARKLGILLKQPTAPQEKEKAAKNQTYLSEMKKVYKECFNTLKPGGHMVLVTKNFRRSGKEVNLLSDTIKLCEMVGFELFQIAYHKLNGASFWQVNAAKKANEKGEPMLLPLIEHIIILKKPKRSKK